MTQFATPIVRRNVTNVSAIKYLDLIMGKIYSKLMFSPPESKYPLDPDFIYLYTRNGSKIPMNIIEKPGEDFYLIISHGNAEDIHHVNEWLDKYFLMKV
jgi:hypothetical protein